MTDVWTMVADHQRAVRDIGLILGAPVVLSTKDGFSDDLVTVRDVAFSSDGPVALRVERAGQSWWVPWHQVTYYRTPETWEIA